jgi:hypothetical protein
MDPGTAQLGVGTPYDGLIAQAAADTGLPVSLIKGVIAAESSWNPAAASSSSMGLMQLNVAAQGISAAQALDPGTNIALGSQILAGQLAQRGDVGLALAGYNAGTGRTNADLSARIAGNVNGVGSYVRNVLAFQAWYAANDPASQGDSTLGSAASSPGSSSSAFSSILTAIGLGPSDPTADPAAAISSDGSVTDFLGSSDFWMLAGVLVLGLVLLGNPGGARWGR